MKCGEDLPDQEDHVEVQLGGHWAVDVLLAEGDRAAPPCCPRKPPSVSLPPGSAVGQRHDHRLPELLSCLHQAADNDRGEQGMAVGHLGVELCVMHHADVHVLGLGWGQRASGDAQADVELRKGDPRPLGGH